MTTITTKPGDASYMDLVCRFPLRPIRSRRQYDEAGKILDELATRGETELDRGEADYLSVLSDLVEAYDQKHCQSTSDDRPVHENIADLVREQGMTQSEFGRLLGVSRPLANLLLNGRRELQKRHILKLAEQFRLDPGYFL